MWIGISFIDHVHGLNKAKKVALPKVSLFVLVSSYDHVIVFILRVFTGLKEFRVR